MPQPACVATGIRSRVSDDLESELNEARELAEHGTSGDRQREPGRETLRQGSVLVSAIGHGIEDVAAST